VEYERGKLVGANYDVVSLKRLEPTLPDGCVVGLGFEDAAVEKEFFCQFLVPLLAKVRGDNDQRPPFSLRPLLRKNQSCLDSFAETNFIRQKRAL